MPDHHHQHFYMGTKAPRNPESKVTKMNAASFEVQHEMISAQLVGRNIWGIKSPAKMKWSSGRTTRQADA